MLCSSALSPLIPEYRLYTTYKLTGKQVLKYNRKNTDQDAC